MKVSFLCILVFIVSNQACTLKNTKTTSQVVSNVELIENKSQQEEKNDVELNINTILNKTFYYITNTDTGDVVVDYYQGGLSGISFTENEIRNFGLESFKVKVDSINIISEEIVVYFANKAGRYHIKTIAKRKGYIEINDVSKLIDSIYAGKTIPIVKEEPYDIREAIGDF